DAGGTGSGVSREPRAPGPVHEDRGSPRRWWTGRVRRSERPHAPGQDPRRATSCSASSARASAEALGSAIDVETVVAEKTNERHPKSAGGRDGKAGRRADGGHDWDASRDRLLHELVPAASADR